MRKVEAIAVYDPQDDPWERAIQDAAKHITGNWLPSHPCRLLARTVGSLKLGSDWLDRDDLLSIRANYLFASDMNSNKQERVFVTRLIFLRDILENREINENLHEPISFMATPLAHFLFRDCSVHIHVNEGLLRAANPKADFLDVGGFLIAQNGDIELRDGVIADVKYYGDQNSERISGLVNEIKDRSGLRFMKAAAVEIDTDVFEIEEHTRALYPEMNVWDKMNRSKATIVEIEPGENAFIRLEYENGSEDSISQEDFDKRFVVT